MQIKTKIILILSLITNQAYGFGWFSKRDTILTRACRNGELAKVRVLIRAGADVNEHCSAPLIYAVAQKHTALIKELLAHPDICANTKIGVTCAGGHIISCPVLALAAFAGHTDTVKLLLAHPGIDVNRANRAYNTPLMCAAVAGRTKEVKLLLAHPDIDVDYFSAMTNRVLIRAAVQKPWLVLGDYNLEVYKDYRVSWSKQAGITALTLAQEYGHLETAAVIEAHIRLRARQQESWERRKNWLVAVDRVANREARRGAGASAGLDLD